MPEHRINMVKRKNHRTSVSPAEKNCIKLVETINNKLKNLNSVEYIKFRDYNTQLLKELGDRSRENILKIEVNFLYQRKPCIIFL